MRCPIDWQKRTSMHTTNQHKVGMTVKNDRLTIEPTARPRYTLEEADQHLLDFIANGMAKLARERGPNC